MDLKPLVKFADTFERIATAAGLPVSDVEELLVDESFVKSCLRAGLQRYASGTKNVIVLSSDDTAETICRKAELTNQSCEYDLMSQCSDRVMKYRLMDLPDDDVRLNIRWMLEHHKESLPQNSVALRAFLTHASCNKNFGRNIPVVLLSEFFNGRDRCYTYAILPDDVGGRKLECITTATQEIDYNTMGGATWSAANMPNPCKVFVVTMS